ncbi:MAG: AAA family ATPase [Syntrophales bacterium]
MKILGVRFKNLNSLVGEWQIDFTHPDYASNGIFAITGPTGAGKTTIMDALCLGLYGTTPRLDRVTKSSNEIMSRRTGECFAEVTFETQKGRYRCHWSQHRSRHRPDGELQQARHEITAADSDKVLESKITQVGEFIAEVTGMDFERFTRSMLLAQGGFATFLLAPPGKRGDILEQITGTEIYSRISMQVHQRRTAERDRLALLQVELQGIQILSAEEVRELQADLAGQKVRESEAAGQKEKLRQALAWLEILAVLEKELEGLDRQRQDCEKRQEEFAPTLKKLARANRALALEGDYRIVAALRGQQAGETKELASAVAQLPAKEQAETAALAVQESAKARLREAQERQLAAGEIMKKVRELDARWTELAKQAAERERAIKQAEQQRKEYGQQLEKLIQARQGMQTDLRIIHDYQTQHAADAALNTNLAAIGRVVEGLRDQESRLRLMEEASAAASGKKVTAAAHCKRLTGDHEAASREFAAEQSELTRLGEEIGGLLKEREISQWRDEQESRKERERLLLQTGEVFARIAGTRQVLVEIRQRLETLTAQQVRLTGEIKTVTDHKELLEIEKASLETQVSLLARIRDLEEERQRLEDGRPCPLCGSIDHPYARGNIPALPEAENKLKDVQVLLRKTVQELGKLEVALARTMAEIRQGEKEREEKQAILAKDDSRYTAALGSLHLCLDGGDRDAQVPAELARVQAKIAATLPLINAAEDYIRREKTAQNALEKRKEKLEKAARTLQEARHVLATAALEQERLDRELKALRSQTELLHAAALREIAPFGVRQLPVGSLDSIMKELTGRRDDWQARAEEEATLEKRGDALTAEIDTANALLANLEKDLAARCQDRDDLAGKQEGLRVARRELFGDKNPDAEEKILRDAATQAETAWEKARAAAMEREKEKAALKERVASLQDKTAGRAAELAGAERLLAERLSKAEFADEADYLAARLTEAEREGLAAAEASLLRAMTELSALREDKVAMLQREREKQTTDLPYDTLHREQAACEANLRQLQEGIGARKNRLRENEDLQARQQERLQKVAAQSNECLRWDELHQIIGSADGKKFRNFAQGLTFELLTTQANRQLRKLTDRYLLVRDVLQPLELSVIDNYQAGEIRSTKNLSGGESFIVSLSLALGLSQMASRNVRVDSLFLDEGFGTLDEDALETALETLAGLRQDGKLIGVISHVAALKERIGTQIQVIPETGGRSSINGPGCRRI